MNYKKVKFFETFFFLKKDIYLKSSSFYYKYQKNVIKKKHT